MVGHYTDNHDQNHREIHLHLPALESLYLWNLPSLVTMCPKQYRMTFPPLKDLELSNCGEVTNIKSIGDFITHHSVTRSPDGTIIKVSLFLCIFVVCEFNTWTIQEEYHWIAINSNLEIE